MTSLANPFIRWEETEQYDIGLDISLFKNRVEFVIDYFNRDSKDIFIYKFPSPGTLG
jgi:outer membrane receptor protein involved in Fe transport